MFSDMLNFDLPKNQSSIIKVLGVGGGGSNAVNHMYNLGIKGVDFIICNTDSQALDISPVPTKIQLGSGLTEGRGAGSVPAVGKNAALESIEQIREALSKQTKMLFITAGMGGGTGTGGAPVIAEAASELDILTVGIVTTPFSFEGRKRKLQADEGIIELRKHIDTLLIVCNDKLRELYGNLAFSEAFHKADNILATGAKGIAEIITGKGYVNVDFEDVKTVMKNSGVAIMGSGQAEGDNRAMKAVEMAMSSPLLNDNEIRGASDILLNITSGQDELSMDEFTEITDYIQEEAGQTAEIIWGNAVDESLGDKINVTLVATGFDANTEFSYEALSGKKEKKYFKLNEKAEEEKNKKQVDEEEDNDEIKLINKKKQEEKKNYNKSVNEKIEEENVLQDESSDEDYTKEKDGEFVLIKKTKKKIQEKEDTEITEKKQKEQKALEIESKLIGKNKDRVERLKEMSLKLKTPQGVTQLESVPAYKRRNVRLSKTPSSSESNISRYTLSEDEEKNVEIKSNNSYLHDNVD